MDKVGKEKKEKEKRNKEGRGRRVVKIEWRRVAGVVFFMWWWSSRLVARVCSILLLSSHIISTTATQVQNPTPYHIESESESQILVVYY